MGWRRRMKLRCVCLVLNETKIARAADQHSLCLSKSILEKDGNFKGLQKRANKAAKKAEANNMKQQSKNNRG